MPNLMGELFRTSAAIDLTYVPYPSTSQALADIMGGRISVIVDSFVSLRGAIQGGTVKVLGDHVRRASVQSPGCADCCRSDPWFCCVGLVRIDGADRHAG